MPDHLAIKWLDLPRLTAIVAGGEVYHTHLSVMVTAGNSHISLATLLSARKLYLNRLNDVPFLVQQV
jgi:hypothetical protein